MNGGKGPPDFEKPPVIEVVCGILFKPLSSLFSPHLGLLWEKYKADYPNCTEVAPLDPIIEKFDASREMTIDISRTPPLPRVQFIHRTENQIIQVQRDRFLHNWRKVRASDEYPRYKHIKQMYLDNHEKFRQFLQENSIGKIEPLQYEMTYINHIPEGDGWSRMEEIGNIFPDFAFRVNEDRFLPEPAAVNLRTAFVLPHKVGRMHVLIRNVKLRKSGKPIFLLELTVRGIGADSSSRAMCQWFDLARDWIVRGFSDITDEKVQSKIWKKIS